MRACQHAVDVIDVCLITQQALIVQQAIMQLPLPVGQVRACQHAVDVIDVCLIAQHATRQVFLEIGCLCQQLLALGLQDNLLACL